VKTPRLAERILLIGWDGADWDVITPLLDAGRLPNLERLVDRGVMGDLIAPAPRLCPLLWTTLLTGRRADAHGVLTADEPDPSTGGRRPVPAARRQVEAIWGILTRAGLRSHAVNWPASHPAEAINGVSVSELYPRVVGPVDEPWPLPSGSISPASLEPILADLRVHPADLDGRTLQAFVPRASEVDQSADRRLELLATIVADATTVHAAATWLIERQPSDLLAVRYGGIERASRCFMPYHPPRLTETPERDFDLYRDVVAAVYQFHDLLLGRLIELAGPDTTILLVSDHGFRSGRLRPSHPTHVDEAWHRSAGILVAAGPALKQDERISGASLFDIIPTVLALLGLPTARNMDGRPLNGLFKEIPSMAYRTTWEPDDTSRENEVEVGREPTASAELQDAFAQLTACCGLDEPPDSDVERRAARLDRQAREFNLARAHLAGGRPAEAARFLDALNRENPAETQFALHLAHCRLQLGQPEECRQLVARSFDRPSDRHVAAYFLGRAAILEGKQEEAVKCFRRAENDQTGNPELYLQLGDSYSSLACWSDAERVFKRVLAIDAESLAAYNGLARVYLEVGDLAGAVVAARLAVARRHDDARARYLLGVGLARLGRIDEAIEALETCLTLHPSIADASRWLKLLHQRRSAARSRFGGRRILGVSS
jgi:predicted AlkP superfamily phosphohydrolase/phosphomutase/tetratricopeptide (TPR) repeat protein